MRARKQRELGGLAAFLILIWIIIGFPTRVNFKLTAATAGFTITTTTKTYFDKHEIYRSNTNNNGTVIQDEEGNQIDILMERNISYYSIPLRETPATVWHTLVAKWSAQRVDMNLHVIEQPLRLLGRGAMLFHPWDVWIDHARQNRQGLVYHARTEKIRHESTELETNADARQAYLRIGANYRYQAVRRTKKDILFDSNTAVRCQASAGNGTVTQDFDLACLEGKALTDEIAGELTWESLQLRLPWDVWIGHALNKQKGEVYMTQKDREVEFDQSRHEGVVSHIQVKRRMKLEILFDLIAADVCQAFVVICTVTQDVDLGRFDGAASTDDIAGESTWETLQLLLPWDVWEICQFQINQHQKEYFLLHGDNLAQVWPSGNLKCRCVHTQPHGVSVTRLVCATIEVAAASQHYFPSACTISTITARADGVRRKTRANGALSIVAAYGSLTGGNTLVELSLGIDEEALDGSRTFKSTSLNSNDQCAPPRFDGALRLVQSSLDTKGGAMVVVEGYRDKEGPRPASMNEVAAKRNE